MDSFTLDALQNMIGDSIKISDENSGIEIETVISAVEPGPMNGNEWESFSATMTSSEGLPCLSQGTYKINNDKLGEGDMFISPNSPTQYEIIVSRKKN